MNEQEIQQAIDKINSIVRRTKSDGIQVTQRQMLNEVYSLFNRLDNHHYVVRVKISNCDSELHIYKMTTQITISLLYNNKDDMDLDDLPYVLLRDIYRLRFDILKNMTLGAF